jgi:hypothetical protein
MLRRTGFRSKWQKPPKQELVIPASPQKPRAVMYAANDSGPVPVPKDEPVRSRAYREWVATWPCFACGLAGHSQAAHSNSPKHGKGKGLKADDRFVFPLCAARPSRVGCHEQHDLLLDMSREQRREAEERYVERMHRQAEADGWCLKTLKRKV